MYLSGSLEEFGWSALPTIDNWPDGISGVTSAVNPGLPAVESENHEPSAGEAIEERQERAVKKGCNGTIADHASSVLSSRSANHDAGGTRDYRI